MDPRTGFIKFGLSVLDHGSRSYGGLMGRVRSRGKLTVFFFFCLYHIRVVHSFVFICHRLLSHGSEVTPSGWTLV